MTQPILQVENLCTEFRTDNGFVRAVDNVSFEVDPGEMLAVVGSSGCGKSALLRSLIGAHHAHPGVVSGHVQFNLSSSVSPYEGIDSAVRRRLDKKGQTKSIRVKRGWHGTVQRRLQRVRGPEIGMVLQDGRTALDPSQTLGEQFLHVGKEKAAAWLNKLGFENAKAALSSRPHQLSGGMAQRAMLAVVLSRKPSLLLLDELTTGLDVSLQASVLKLLERLHHQLGFTALVVTHDLGLAKTISNRTMIMDKGKIVDWDDTDALFQGNHRRSQITERLLEAGRQEQLSVPPMATQPPLQAASPLLSAKNVRRIFVSQQRRVVAVDDVSLQIQPDSCVALVGESGSGKTTLAHLLSGLQTASEGVLRFGQHDLADLADSDRNNIKKRRTVLFQNPYTSLNPQMTPRASISEGLQHHGASKSEADARAVELLQSIGLGARSEARLASMSGGERRRVGLLKTLHSPADVVILDEPTAGLDALNRQQVAALITAAKGSVPNRAILVVSHDLGFVSRVADRVVVMFRGRIVEDSTNAAFVDTHRRHHPYTEQLFRAARYVAGDRSTVTQIPERRRDLGETTALPSTAGGCLYRDRCSIYRADPDRWIPCERQRPALAQAGHNIVAACHGVNHEN